MLDGWSIKQITVFTESRWNGPATVAPHIRGCHRNYPSRYSRNLAVVVDLNPTLWSVSRDLRRRATRPRSRAWIRTPFLPRTMSRSADRLDVAGHGPGGVLQHVQPSQFGRGDRPAEAVLFLEGEDRASGRCCAILAPDGQADYPTTPPPMTPTAELLNRSPRARDRSRTCDLLFTRQPLCLLSYSGAPPERKPVSGGCGIMAPICAKLFGMCDSRWAEGRSRGSLPSGGWGGKLEP